MRNLPGKILLNHNIVLYTFVGLNLCEYGIRNLEGKTDESNSQGSEKVACNDLRTAFRNIAPSNVVENVGNDVWPNVTDLDLILVVK